MPAALLEVGLDAGEVADGEIITMPLGLATCCNMAMVTPLTLATPGPRCRRGGRPALPRGYALVTRRARGPLSALPMKV